MTTLYYTATSVDGFIADENDKLEWLFATKQDPDDFHERLFATVGAMCMGATTYEWLSERVFGTQWRDAYGDMPCWVFTHRDLPVIPDANLRFVSGDVAPVHADMHRAAGEANIWLLGGGELVGQFFDAGLLDEIHLGVAPAFLGAGAPLLPRRITAERLWLRDVDRSNQLVRLSYRVTPQSLPQRV